MNADSPGSGGPASDGPAPGAPAAGSPAADDGVAAAGTASSAGTEAAPSLLTFPVDFPIKVMGRSVDGFTEAIVAIVLEHAPDFDPSTLESRPSTQGNYLGVTATIHATSREQLDALYLALTAHPLVKVVL